MSILIGDPVFSHLGGPGVAVPSERPRELKVDSDLKAVQTEFRHGYLKGLNPEVRNDFYAIMDDITATEGTIAKVTKLQAKIREIEDDDTVSAHTRPIVGYLKAELAHLMNSSHYTPRFYEIPITRAPP